MSRTFFTAQFLSSRVIVLLFGALGVVFYPTTSRATTEQINTNCANLDPAQGGAALTTGAPGDTQMSITLAAGDVINVSRSDGNDISYTPAGGGATTTASPASLTVGAGQAGIWSFDRTPFTVTYTTSCTVFVAPPSTGPTAQDKSNTVNHLSSAFNQIGGSIFAGESVPGQIFNGGIGTGNTAGFALSSLAPAAGFNASNPMNDAYGPALAMAGSERYLDQVRGNRFGNGFNFSVNLNTSAADSPEEPGKELHGYSSMKDGSHAPVSRWTPWISGRYSEFDDDTRNADRDGEHWWITSGLNYQLNDNTNVGAFTRVRRGEVDSNALNASLESDFFGGGVYLSTKTSSGVRLLTGALYESGDNDATISNATGSYDSEQLTLEAQIDKRINMGRHWIAPGVKILYANLDRDAYTDSAGATIAGNTITLGRLSFGPTIGTTIQHGDTSILPFARINGIWDFENENAFALSTGTTVSSGADTAIRLGGGLEVQYASGFALKVSGDWVNFENDLEGWTISGGIGAPLSVFGFQHSALGTVSLDLSAREDDASAHARLRIPLGSTQ